MFFRYKLPPVIRPPLIGTLKCGCGGSSSVSINFSIIGLEPLTPNLNEAICNRKDDLFIVFKNKSSLIGNSSPSKPCSTSNSINSFNVLPTSSPWCSVSLREEIIIVGVTLVIA